MMNRRELLHATIVAGGAMLLPESALGEGDAVPAWPSVNGPTGNFNPRRSGIKLLDDLKDTKRLWLSDFADLGFAKGSASGFFNHLADPTTHPGSSSGLIVADGRVYASSFRPCGDVWAEKAPGMAAALEKFTGEQLAALKRNAALDADDLTVAIDLRTGKTLWTAVETGKGLNRYSGKRLQFHGTPVYHAGRVFSLGTTGRVYAYDAASGKKLWEEESGSLVQSADALKKRLLNDRNALPGGDGMGTSPVVADGVLVVPQFPAAGQDVGLRGIDVATGKTLWGVPACTRRFATPAVWRHKDREYLLVATVKGELRLIDPRDGKVRWKLDGLEPTYYPLSPSEGHVFVNVKGTENARKPGQSWGRLGAIRLSPEKGEHAWAVPDRGPFWFENHMDICAMRRVAVRDGRVYYATQGKPFAPDRTTYFLHILLG